MDIYTFCIRLSWRLAKVINYPIFSTTRQIPIIIIIIIIAIMIIIIIKVIIKIIIIIITHISISLRNYIEKMNDY